MLMTSLAALAGVSILSKAYWNTFRPELKTVTLHLSDDKLKSRLNILQLSDLHIERLSVKPERIKQMVGSHTFDLIVLTGDYLDRAKNMDRFLNFLRQMMEIPSTYGIYAVWGNHDWMLGDKLTELRQKMVALGVTVLGNESLTLSIDGTPVHIIGIDDHYSGHADIDKAFSHVPEGGIRLILSHDPLVVHKLSTTFDYMLSGHFHSGQIYYPLPIHSIKMGLRPYKRLLSGLQNHPFGTYYISGGLGQTGANLRLGCKPEITIHRLVPVANKKHREQSRIASSLSGISK